MMTAQSWVHWDTNVHGTDMYMLRLKSTLSLNDLLWHK